jgi:hypothetical protein
LFWANCFQNTEENSQFKFCRIVRSIGGEITADWQIFCNIFEGRMKICQRSVVYEKDQNQRLSSCCNRVRGDLRLFDRQSAFFGQRNLKERGEKAGCLRALSMAEHGSEDHHPETKPETKKTAEETILTDKEAARLIEGKIGKEYPVKNIGVHFESDGGLQITAAVSKEDLKSYMKDNNLQLPASESLLFVVLPSELHVLGDCTLAVEPDSGLLILTPEDLKIEGGNFRQTHFPRKSLTASQTR